MEAVAINTIDNAERVKDFKKEFKLTMPLVLDGEGRNNAADANKINGSPTIVVIAPNGKVTAVFEGEDEAGLLKALRDLGFKD